MRIYLDVDDTLIDFRRHCVSRGVPDWAGSWYTQPKETWNSEQLKIDQAVIDQMNMPDFWGTVPVKPGAFALIAAAATRAPTYLLTATPRVCNDAADIARQKMEYCQRVLHFPPERIIVCERPQKIRYATMPSFEKVKVNLSGKEETRAVRVPNLLIDDAAQNVKEWREAGGVAFHYSDDLHEDVLHYIRNGR